MITKGFAQFIIVWALSHYTADNFVKSSTIQNRAVSQGKLMNMGCWLGMSA